MKTIGDEKQEGRKVTLKIRLIQRKETKNNDILILFTSRNKELASSFQLLLNEMTRTIKAYDSEHNLYHIAIIQIVYIKLVDNYRYIHTVNGVYTADISFKKLRETVESKDFCQIDVRTIVNLHYVKSYCIKQNCHRELRLYSDKKLTVNRRYVKIFIQMMKEVKGT